MNSFLHREDERSLTLCVRGVDRRAAHKHNANRRRICPITGFHHVQGSHSVQVQRFERRAAGDEQLDDVRDLGATVAAIP